MKHTLAFACISLKSVWQAVCRPFLSRIRNGDAAENFGCMRKFVLSLLKRDTSEGSMKRKRKRAAWSTIFLESLLFE